MDHKRLPSITFITTTYNANLRLFKRCLDSIAKQEYPKNLLEHIVVDGGSTNGAIELARKYNCKVIRCPDLTEEQEVRASIGIQRAKGEVYAILQSDNFFTSKKWLKEIIQPFLDHKDIFCTFSAYNGYERDLPLTTRYCALFGSTDPALFYLNKSEKIPLTQKIYNKGDMVTKTSGYYKVRFNEHNLPTIGDNGHFIKRSIMDKVNTDPTRYTHTDAIYELVRMGYDTFGVVNNSLIHVANPNIVNLIKRRVEVKQKYTDEWRGRRKYLVFSWSSDKDRSNLIKYLFFSFTFVEPFYRSMKGYLKINDFAWFLHPILCPLMAIGYGYSELRFLLLRFIRRS